jgi:hypothetical protein
MVGVRNVGEFTRLELRSDAMKRALEKARTSLDEPTSISGGRRHLAVELEALAVQMMSETADWRTLVITRHIELPS